MRIHVFHVKQLLARRGMTQRALASASGLHCGVISATLARGTCSIKTAGKIAAALGVDLSEIVIGAEV